MQIHRAGDRAIVIDVADLTAVHSLARHVRSLDLLGVRDIVPAARTVFISAWSPAAIKRVAAAVSELDPTNSEKAGAERIVDIDVVYDGEDLAEVADQLGLTAEAVVSAHTDQVWTAAFGGFAPGFMYLTSENDILEVPRRKTPRKKVPAGAVAIAGGFSAVYPRASPGGWQLLGRTAAPMWDSRREPPALVSPGDRVRFKAVRELAQAASEKPAKDESTGDLTVVSPGMQALVQDLGRPGFAAIGVTSSGAMDRTAMSLANRLVGNPVSAAAIESLFGGFCLRAERDAVIVVTGAEVDLQVESRYPKTNEPFLLRAGEELTLGTPAAGARAYVAVRGGIDAEPELGSRASDVLSGLGPEPLREGSVLRVGPEPQTAVGEKVRQTPLAAEVTLRFIPGPRDDWFTLESLDRLAVEAWEVTPDSNRVGLRLKGTPLERSRGGELSSEGMTRGSIQVPPDGQPVLFMADHPVTGGYPVIGTVVDPDTDLAGQLVPGNRLRLVPVTAEP